MRPVMAFVAGQPGAGRTGVARMVRRTLRDPAHIRRDGFKVFPPDCFQLLRGEPRRMASARIRVGYRAWQAQTERYVRERRGDVVIELTPSSAGAFMAGAALYRQAGYRVELVVLAVRAADSRQGTANRHPLRRGEPTGCARAVHHRRRARPALRGPARGRGARRAALGRRRGAGDAVRRPPPVPQPPDQPEPVGAMPRRGVGPGRRTDPPVHPR
ncbi:zeta toxin family protein [Streptomyces sp. UNOB3_S3]|nr:zeta toxin family protein [Streptomyces sp. UNOB3_S3]